MAIDALVKPFLSLPLFRALRPLQITEIVRRADRIVFQPGETIIEENQAGSAAFILISGDAVRIDDGDAQTAQAVREGSIIGEMAMLVDTIHSATVVARSNVRALRLGRQEMHALMLEDPRLAEHFSAHITARLKRLAIKLKAVDDALAEIGNQTYALPGSRTSPERVSHH